MRARLERHDAGNRPPADHGIKHAVYVSARLLASAERKIPYEVGRESVKRNGAADLHASNHPSRVVHSAKLIRDKLLKSIGTE